MKKENEFYVLVCILGVSGAAVTVKGMDLLFLKLVLMFKKDPTQLS